MLKHASQRQRVCRKDELHFNGRRVRNFVDRYAPTAGVSTHGMGNRFLLTAEGFVASSITVLKQFRHSLRSAIYCFSFWKWKMPVNSFQSLMLTTSIDMITSVQKGSSRATPTAVVVISTVAASALAKTTIEMHKRMSSVSRTYAAIPRLKWNKC